MNSIVEYNKHLREQYNKWNHCTVVSFVLWTLLTSKWQLDVSEIVICLIYSNRESVGRETHGPGAKCIYSAEQN